jgi:Uma2 family endonuclease
MVGPAAFPSKTRDQQDRSFRTRLSGMGTASVNDHLPGGPNETTRPRDPTRVARQSALCYDRGRWFPIDATLGGGALLSTISKPTDEPDLDAYRYGSRFVRVVAPDGTETVDQVPLTLDDVLFPEPGDDIPNGNAHSDDLSYLMNVFNYKFSNYQTVVGLSRCLVDWNLPGVKPLRPDISLFFGVKGRISSSSIFDVAKEGARPVLVIEVTIPATRINDVGAKVDYYHRAGVPLYVIADVVEQDETDRRFELIRYERTPSRYKRVKSDQRGWIWLNPVHLWLGLTRDRVCGYNRLACFEPNGKEVGDYSAISKDLADLRALTAAESRLRAEVEARAKAEARVRELEAELKRSRARGT